MVKRTTFQDNEVRITAISLEPADFRDKVKSRMGCLIILTLWQVTSDELMEKTGLALVKTFGVERILEPEKLIVQVVAKLMD